MSKITLSQIAKVISKGTTPTSIGLSFTNSGIPFLRGEDIQGFRINEKNVKFYIDENSHQKLSRSEIKYGDVLVTIAGTIGRVSYVSTDIIANMGCLWVNVPRPTAPTVSACQNIWARVSTHKAILQTRASSRPASLSFRSV